MGSVPAVELAGIVQGAGLMPKFRRHLIRKKMANKLFSKHFLALTDTGAKESQNADDSCSGADQWLRCDVGFGTKVIWVAVKELSVNHYIGETISLITISTHYGSLN